VKTDAGLTEGPISDISTRTSLHHMVAGNVDYYIVDGHHFAAGQ